eukprot:g9379.t1
MRAVSALILSSAALLQFFSGSASAVTCDSVSYSCTTAEFVRDPSKNTEVCSSEPTNCDDTDCCMQGTLTCTTSGYLCTTAENVLDPSLATDICTNDCDDAQCCMGGASAASPVTCLSDSHTCTGMGMAADASKDGIYCTNQVCTDFQCCSVNTKCAHYPVGMCIASGMVLDPDQTEEACSSNGGFCDDAFCCKTTCGSADYQGCDPGETRNDDATCAGGGCAPAECCTDPVDCSHELHQCPTGYHRVGANQCSGTGLCTDAECCEADLVSTITAARQKRTPMSRQHLTQYGTKA